MAVSLEITTLRLPEVIGSFVRYYSHSAGFLRQVIIDFF
jgi:hypothetical protein